jgi:hypothetical protein
MWLTQAYNCVVDAGAGRFYSRQVSLWRFPRQGQPFVGGSYRGIGCRRSAIATVSGFGGAHSALDATATAKGGRTSNGSADGMGGARGTRSAPKNARCSNGDPIAGLLSRGRERDLPGSQAIRPVPLPRSRTPAEPAMPCLITVSPMLPPLPSQRRLQRNGNFGATTQLQHLLPNFHERCCHHPCKARFRRAGSPLQEGS